MGSVDSNVSNDKTHLTDSQSHKPKTTSASTLIPSRIDIQPKPPKERLRNSQNNDKSSQELEVCPQSLPLPKVEWPASGFILVFSQTAGLVVSSSLWCVV